MTHPLRQTQNTHQPSKTFNQHNKPIKQKPNLSHYLLPFLSFSFLSFSSTSPCKIPKLVSCDHLSLQFNTQISPHAIQQITHQPKFEISNHNMSTVEVVEPEKQPQPSPAPVPENDVERGSTPATGSSGFGVGSVLRRWKREDMLKKGSLALRTLGLLFSLLSFIIMASNNHGDWREFGKYEEYRYVLGIAILSTLYTGLQSFRYVHKLQTGKDLVALKTAALIDFFGDQIMAYLLLSSASSAIPLTNRMREGGDNIFTDSSAAAISMSLLAFLVLACSSLVAGYKLSTQSYI